MIDCNYEKKNIYLYYVTIIFLSGNLGIYSLDFLWLEFIFSFFALFHEPQSLIMSSSRVET